MQGLSPRSRPLRLLPSVALLALSGLCGCALLIPPRERLAGDVGPGEVRRAPAGELLAGAAWVDVTPRQPSYMAGYKVNKRHAEVHDPIKVRALALRRGGLDVVLVSCDLIGLHAYQVDEVRRRLGGLVAPEALLVASTHNHAGPDTLGMWGLPPLWTGLEPAVVEGVLAGIVRAVEGALLDLTPVRVRWGELEAPTEGISRNRREPTLIDRRLTAIGFDRPSGEAVATLVHFACHPETLGSDNRILSADFPGVLCATVEAARPGSTTLFLNGALGGMVSVDRRERTIAEMTRIGQALGDLALAALAQERELGGEALSLAVARRKVAVPIEARFFQLALRLGIFGPRPLEGGRTPSEVVGVRLGSAIFLSAFGEVLPKLGFELDAEISGEPGLVVGLGNDELGYLLHPSDWGRELYSYEMGVSPGPLASEILGEAAAAVLSDLTREE